MRSLVITVLIILLLAGRAFSSDDDITMQDLMQEIRALKTKVSELEDKLTQQARKVEKQEKVIARKAEKTEHIDTHILHKEDGGYRIPGGLKIDAGATFVGQFAVNPNESGTEEEQVLDGTYSIDIEIEKEIGENGLAFIHLESGEGNGLDLDEITTFSAVNRDAANTGSEVDVTEVWYEHGFLDNRFVITGGKLDTTIYMDQNTVANDETSQFLSTIFRNSSAIDFPTGINTWGFRTAFVPYDWIEIGTGIFDDDNDWEDLLEDYFTFSQVNIKPNLMDREGNYRLYGWYDDSKHAKWSDPNTDTQSNFGFGTSCDQRVTDYLTLFGRFGWEDPDVSTVEWTWSSGFQLDGPLWKRDKDFIGCAIGMDIPSDEYGDSGAGYDDPEGHIEAYYSFYVNDHLSISPDYQFIWNPNGSNDDPINIVGLRGQVDF